MIVNFINMLGLKISNSEFRLEATFFIELARKIAYFSLIVI